MKNKNLSSMVCEELSKTLCRIKAMVNVAMSNGMELEEVPGELMYHYFEVIDFEVKKAEDILHRITDRMFT